MNFQDLFTTKLVVCSTTRTTTTTSATTTTIRRRRKLIKQQIHSSHSRWRDDDLKSKIKNIRKANIMIVLAIMLLQAVALSFVVDVQASTPASTSSSSSSTTPTIAILQQQKQQHQLQNTTSTNNMRNNSDISNNNSRMMQAKTDDSFSSGVSNNLTPNLNQVAKAEALTAPASSSKVFEVCKLQSRTGQQLTNLSQIMFQPSEICSTWQMMRSTTSSDHETLNSYPWFYIEQLNLSYNNLTVLHDSSGINKLVNLLELRITHNQLTRCEESSLMGLQRLHHLDLSHNKLVALPSKFFQPVKSTIRKLNLSFNSISVLVPSLFDSLTMLEHLDLSHNDITSHWINDEVFKNLTQLHYLDLSFNKLTVFSYPMTFSSLQQLETLSLQHNELRQVPETIQHLRYLSSLDLSQNLISDITNASYLAKCRLLFNLNLDSNLLENITRDAFSDLPALKVLNLANNRIHHLDQQAFDYVPDLHALRLDSNKLVEFGTAFVNLRFLLMLNISSNRISSFDYAQIPLGLQWLDIHSNKIDKLNNFYYSATAQQQFSSTNDINQQNVGSSIGQQWQSMLRLTTLDASHNLIKELDSTALPESLETVQLNNNLIRNIASQTFSTKSNLTRINLSHNQLSSLPYDSIKLHGSHDTSASSVQQQQQQSLVISNGQKFVDIYLANNPFNCNCSMGWFSQLLLASSTLLQGNNILSGNQQLREHQLILTRQLPRVADAHQISCSLPFARHSLYTNNPHQWSPVQAANQLALHHNHHLHTRESTSLIQKQSELLASVHLCPYKSHCFALCYCCDFDACDCEMSCPENCSCYYDQTWSTNIVDCSANNQINNGNSQLYSRAPQFNNNNNYRPSNQPVRFLSIPEKIPMDVTELYLDGLELFQLRGNALIGRRSLKTLYLNNSQVASIEPKAFATQKALKVLQLNSNYLSELHGYEFEHQLELRELYLANNQLTTISNMTFTPLRSLQILHLQNNQLYHLNLASNLPAGHRLVSLSLGSNPWSCQCDHVESMMRWLHANVKHIHDRKSVTCQYNRTNTLHLLSHTSVTTFDQDSSISFNSLNENYPMFEMRMCLNYTVYPIIPPSTSSPSTLLASEFQTRTELNQAQGFPSKEFQQTPPTFAGEEQLGVSTGIFQTPLQPPSEAPFTGSTSSSSSSMSQQPLTPNDNNPVPYPGGYQFPPPNMKSNVFSSSFLLSATLTFLLIIILVVSLVHYRRSMGMWFYSRYGLNMFSATKHSHHKHGVGSLGKHAALHHHHQHPHLHHHQYGASSAGSTSSSSAASSNLSQGLCHQQQSSSIPQSGLVTTPLIVSNNHQLLSSPAVTTTTTSPYHDDEKLFDAYLTYSKLDEQFISDFIAPELEYGQPSYRVALHYRDLPVTTSEFLTDCIIETANASRRIIMILSEQMLKTEWLQYEFRSAHLEALRNNYRQRLIIIMLDDPHHDLAASLAACTSIDSELLLWIKSCTCIHWGDKMFWSRLRYALPEIPFNRQQHYLPAQQQQQQQQRYQTLTSTGHQQQNTGSKSNNGKLGGVNLLKSANLFGIGTGGGANNNHHQLQHQHQQQLMLMNNTSQQQQQQLPAPLNRPPLPLPLANKQQQQQMMLPQQQQNNNSQSQVAAAEEHHYAHLTPSTMIYNQQQTATHTYHQPIYGDPQQQQAAQQQQQQQQRDNPTVPVHI